MKTIAIIFAALIFLSSVQILDAQNYNRQGNYRTRPVGELNGVKFRIEQGPVVFMRTDILGISHYFNRIGIGIELFRYMEVINDNTLLPEGTAMIEWLPVRISYIYYLKRAKYRGGEWQNMENEPFFIWGSVTPYEYAKTYIRMYIETSYRQVLRYSMPYPLVLTCGVQFSHGLFSVDGGYRVQSHKWTGYADRNPYVRREPFTLTGPYISANFTIGAILTRTDLSL